MIPKSFKPGMYIYVNMHSLGVINMYKYEGNGIFDSATGKVDLSQMNWEDMFYSFSEEHAECKSYLYKLNQLQKQLDDETKRAIRTTLTIEELNKKFSHLKKKFPEEFI